MLIKKMVWTLAVTYLNWKLSSGWVELVTGISTTCVEAIDSEDGFWQVVETSVATTVFLKSPVTHMNIFNQGNADYFIHLLFQDKRPLSLALHCMVLSKKRVLFNFVVLCFQWNFADIFPSSIEKFQVHHTKQYCEIKGNIFASLPGRGKASLTYTVYLHCKFLIPKWLPCLSCCFSFPWRLFSINYQFHIRISLS